MNGLVSYRTLVRPTQRRLCVVAWLNNTVFTSISRVRYARYISHISFNLSRDHHKPSETLAPEVDHGTVLRSSFDKFDELTLQKAKN